MLQDITAPPGVEYSEDLIVFLTILFRCIHSFKEAFCQGSKEEMKWELIKAWGEFREVNCNNQNESMFLERALVLLPL